MNVNRPERLADKGGALWDSIAGTYALRPDEIRVLEDACREADLIQRLEDQLVDADLMVKGSMGQLVSSPLVSEVRQHRATLKALLGSLKLPDEAPVEDSASSAARKAATARWSRGA
jgi:hypothetical protein